jgi:hypothetical protein
MKRVSFGYLRSMLPFRWVAMGLFYITYKLIIWICLPSKWWCALPAVVLTDLIMGIGRESPLLNWVERRFGRKK